MAEYTADALQIINPGEYAIFTNTADPCNLGLIRHRDETGNFLLAGRCRCKRQPAAKYFVDFKADIAVPTGSEVGPITVAVTVDGATVPASTMTSTPAAVEEFNNVSAALNVPIWNGCCETVGIRNTSSVPIAMQHANIVFDRPDLR